ERVVIHLVLESRHRDNIMRARFARAIFGGVRECLRSHPGRHGVTGVAIVAAPIRRHRLTEVLEDDARTALGSLAEPDDRPELGLVLGPALLVVDEIAAQVDLREPPRQPLPASAAMLADEAMALEQREHDAGLATRNAGRVGEVVEWHGGF